MLKRTIENLLISGFFPAAISWPVLLNPSGYFVGSSISDSAYIAGYYSSLRVAGLSPFSSVINEYIGSPDGVLNRGVLNAVSPASTLITQIFSHLTSSMAAQYWIGFAGLSLTCLSVIYCVSKLFNSRAIAIFCGVLISINPIMYNWWSAVPINTHAWIYVLTIYYGWILKEQVTFRNVGILSSLFFISLLWTPYYGFFTSLIVLTSVVRASFARRLTIRHFCLVFGPSIILIIFYKYLGHLYVDQIPKRETGDIASRYLSLTKLSLPTSSNYIPLVIRLGLVAFIGSFLHALISKSKGNKNNTLELSAYFSSLMTIIFFVCSSWSFTNTPLISKAIPLLVPQLRNMDYVAQLLNVCFILSCGLVLHNVRQTVNRIKFSVILLAIFCWAMIDGHRLPETDSVRWMNKFEKSNSVIETLEREPRGLTVHFPWELSDEFPLFSSPIPCIMQGTHQQPLVNSCDYARPFGEHARKIYSSTGCDKLETLFALRVQYILVSASYAQPNFISCLNADSRLKELASDDHLQLWRFSNGLTQPLQIQS
jgi:hypothetical protein